MPLPPDHAAVLRRVSAGLSAVGIRHGVGGSGLLALLGLPVTVRDLDIEVDRRDRTAVTGVPVLRAFAEVDPFAERGPIIRTARGELGGGRMWRGGIGGVPVEVFEHPALRAGAEWRTLPLRLAGPAELDGDEIPLAEAAFWWALYTVLSPAKAELLEPLVPAADRERAAAELGLSG